MVLLLFVAGHETTVNLIGNGTPAHGASRRARTLPSRSLLDATAVDELCAWTVRCSSPLRCSSGSTSDPQFVEKGAVVMPVLGAANHDPTHFVDPDALVIDRPNAASHLALGSGIHFCLGASLARLEAQVAIGRFLRRFETVEYAGEPEWAPRISLRGMAKLPLAVS